MKAHISLLVRKLKESDEDGRGSPTIVRQELKELVKPSNLDRNRQMAPQVCFIFDMHPIFSLKIVFLVQELETEVDNGSVFPLLRL